MPATLDLDRLNKRVLTGRSAPLPSKPRGDGKDNPQKAKFIRRVVDLDNPQDVVRAVLARARNAADFRRPHEEDWRKSVRAWFQRTSEEREESWESDRYLPIVLKHVETAIPSLVAATLDGNRIWKLEGLTRTGKDAARALTRLVNWQAYTVSGAEEAYEDMYWWAAVLGTAFVDHYWDYREEVGFGAIVREVVEAGTGMRRKIKEVTEQNLVVADHPRLVCLNPLDVFADPEGSMGDDVNWYVERVRTTIGALRDSAGQGHIDGEALEEWIDQFKPAERANSEGDWFDDLVSDTWDEWLREIGMEGRGDTVDDDDLVTQDLPVTLMRYRSKKEIITLGSREHIIGYSPNPYIHRKTGIVDHQFFKIPNCPYGRGIGTILLGHQSLANENINRWMDTAAIEANAPIIVDRSAVSILDDEFVFEPNKIIRARTVDAVKRMEVPAPTNLAMLTDQHLQRDADDVTGFSEQARGVAQGGQTATAFSGLQSNLKTRLLLHVRRASRTIRQSGELLVALDQQFMTEAQVVALVGEEAEDYVTIEPWEIVGKTVVRATLNASRANPELRAQRLVALTQVVLPILQAQGDPAIVFRWARMLLDENDVEDVDLLIPRNSGKARDPMLENEALKHGVKIDALPAEDHAMHIQTHAPLHEELLAAGAVGAASVVAAHIQTHMLLAQAQAQAMMAAGEVPAEDAAGGPGGGNTDGEREGSATEGAAARDGTPGVASPGPAGAPGRPMGR